MESLSSFDKRFALLIDADNVSAKYIKPILDELSKYGTVTIKRIYGDWTSTLHAKWKDALLDNSITPIQQFSYTVGKNATDSAMIIDAMDILYTNSVDGFCLVSSDSDFTRLASRIRESGLTVVGMGEKKTPTPFRKACDVFTTLELLVGEARRGKEGASSLTIEEVERAVVGIITDNQNNGKSTGLGEVGSRLLKRYPDFDVRSFGTNLLSKLLSEFKSVNIRKEGSNVRVELAEGVEHESASAKQQPSDKPVRSGRRLGKASQHAKGQAGDPEERQVPADDATSEDSAVKDAPEGEAAQPVDDVPETDEAARSAKPRRRRGRRRKSAHGDDGASSSAENAANEEAASGPTSDALPAESVEKKEGASVPSESEDVAQAHGRVDSPAAEAKPHASKPSASRRKKPVAADKAKAPSAGAASADLVAGEVVTSEVEAAGTAAPAASDADEASTDSATHEAAIDAPEAQGEPKPARTRKRTPRSRKPKAARTKPASPDDFIRQTVAEAGADGVAVSELARQVRARFKSFKVRDLGYPHMAGYLADVEGVRVYKQGRENWVAKE